MNLKEILNLIDENTFISSDHHFGHKNITKYEPIRVQRAKELGYNSWEDMVIEEHNKIVKADDNVLFMGDFAMKGYDKYFKALNGNKILILGNHDRANHTSYRDNNIKVIRGLLIDYNDYVLELNQEDKLFSAIIKNIEVNGKNKEIMFSHYSLFNKDDYDRRNNKIKKRMDILEDMYDSFSCTVNVHGHLHSSIHKIDKDKLNLIYEPYNTCLEVNDFKPKRLKEIIY